MHLFGGKKWTKKLSVVSQQNFLHDAPLQSRKVSNVDDGMRLDRFLRNNFGFPQSLIEKFVRKNKVFYLNVNLFNFNSNRLH